MSFPFGPSELIIADTEQAVAFLANFHRDRKRHLVAISLTGVVEAQSFGPDQDEELFAWINNRRQGVANVYQHVNNLKAGVANVKAKRTQVDQAFYLHVDVDDPDALERRPASLVLARHSRPMEVHDLPVCTSLREHEGDPSRVTERLAISYSR